MPKQIIGETFEQLGQTVKQTGKQIVGEPGKVAETAARQAGIKPEPGIEQPQGKGLTPAQMAQKREKEKQRLSSLQTELKALQQKQTQELPRQISGKPGFSEEKAIKQIQIEKEEKKKLPPMVELAKKKGGTGERKIMGVSG